MTHKSLFSTNADKGDAEQPWLDLAAARVPTPEELAVRVNPIKQVAPFVTFSLRLTRMVLAGHR